VGRDHESGAQIKSLEGDITHVVWRQAAPVNAKTKKKRMKLWNSQGFKTLSDHLPRVDRHRAVDPGGPGDGVVATAIAQRGHPTLFAVAEQR